MRMCVHAFICISSEIYSVSARIMHAINQCSGGRKTNFNIIILNNVTQLESNAQAEPCCIFGYTTPIELFERIKRL